MLLSFKISIYFTLISFDSNFNYLKAQMSVFVTFIHWVPFWYFPNSKWKIIRTFVFVSVWLIRFCQLFNKRIVHKLSCFLKRCFTRINTCLCELIGCAGEESVGLYIQISTVIHPRPLIAVNYDCVKIISTILHVKMGCSFVCDDLFFSFPCFFNLHTCGSDIVFSLYLYMLLILALLNWWILIRAVLGVLRG